MVTAYAPVGHYVTTRLATVSNIRTSMGQSGTISLVTPTLVHGFLTDSDPENLTLQLGGVAFQTTLTLELLPEPEQGLMLGAGFSGLVALQVRRRHRKASNSETPL